ncbi:hypothetical protein HanPSC8_Chr06g0246581 [Helianthus annuus]|nr:hypothetical protein HanPSC8_Chr06g0246581 [Helianthus annuus]
MFFYTEMAVGALVLPHLIRSLIKTMRTTYTNSGSDSEENVDDDPRERYTVWTQTYTFRYHFYSVSSNSLNFRCHLTFKSPLFQRNYQSPFNSFN